MLCSYNTDVVVVIGSSGCILLVYVIKGLKVCILSVNCLNAYIVFDSLIVTISCQPCDYELLLHHILHVYRFNIVKFYLTNDLIVVFYNFKSITFRKFAIITVTWLK